MPDDVLEICKVGILARYWNLETGSQFEC